MMPLDVIIVGQALNTWGLTAFNTVEGLGLNSWGNYWPCSGIWAPGQDTITTVWGSCSIPGADTEICTD